MCSGWMCRWWWTSESARIGGTQNETYVISFDWSAGGMFVPERGREPNRAGGIQGEVRYQQRFVRNRSASRVGAERRGSVLRAGEERVFRRGALLPRGAGFRGAVGN